MASENNSLPKVHVLVVDDLPSNLLVARGLLASYGLQADTAASGKEAIELAKKHNYDIIFMDHMMHEMDGVEAAAAIRKINGYAPTPIIALTANDLRGMKEFYLENSFNDYLSKPINPEALDDIIKKYIGDWGLVSALFPTPFSLEIEAQRLDILNHYLVSFTSVPESDRRTKYDSAYFERFTALIKSLNTYEMPEALREQADILAAAGRKEDARKIQETLPAFCRVLQKWLEQKQKAEAGEHNINRRMPNGISPKFKKTITIKILVVEDQTMLRESLEQIIGNQNDMEIAGSTDDAANAPELCRELRPDLVLMDVVTKNNASGITYTAQIRAKFPNIKIVIMTGFSDITFIAEARKAGAHSYVYKNSGFEHLFYVIRSTMQGNGIYPGPENRFSIDAQFNERELAVIRMVCKGKSRTEIVKELGMSEAVVKRIISTILDKTGFDNIMKFAIYAVSRGLIVPDSEK